MFARSGVASLETSGSLKTFLSNVANYKDVDSTDLVFFSSSATNLKTDPFYRIWEIRRNSTPKLVEWDQQLTGKLDEIDALSRKYYFDIVERSMTHEKGVTYIDDEKLERELNPIDPDLLKHK